MYGSQDPRARFLTDLGFEIPVAINTLAGKQFYTEISAERFDLLGANVLIWIVSGEEAPKALEENPLYKQLRAVKEGRDIFPNEMQRNALSFGTVLSLPFALDELIPMITAAVDGDSTTKRCISRADRDTLKLC